MCEKTGSFHKLDCVSRNCSSCGTTKLQKRLKDLITDEKQIVSFGRWENCKLETSSIMKLTTKQETIGSVIDLAIADINAIAEHLFRADWQFEAFKTQKSSLKSKECLQVLDFSQNYLCVYQDEAQGAHWYHNQVTVHPVVSYYKCPCGDTIREESIILSDDLQHDAHAVNVFMDVVDKHLKEVRGLEVNKVVQYTDGAASQYKGITAFSYLAKKTTPTTRNFFGSRHGKGPCDTAGGVVKNATRRAVMGRKMIIRNVDDMFEFSTKHLTVGKLDKSECNGKHMRRTFFRVASSDIKRPPKDTTLRPIKGTRKLHCISNVSNTAKESTGALTVQIRNLTCLCTGCQSNGECCHQDQVEPKKLVSLTKGYKIPRNVKTKSKPIADSSKSDSDSDSEPLSKCCKLDHHTPTEQHSKKNHKDINVTKPSSHSAKEDLTEIKDRNKFFSRLLQEMAKQKNFRDLSSLLHNYMQKIQSFPLPKGKHRTVKEVIHTQRDVDEYSSNITPFDIPGNHTFIARAIIGDGNCLFRTGSILCHGHENDYKELRVRVIAELCIHEEQYLDPDFLSLGHEARNDYAEKYCQYTQQYMAEKVKGNPTVVRKLYEDQVYLSRLNGVWASLWEIHGMASILQTNLYSVYPMYGYNVRRDTHRLILSRKAVTHTAFIMWTNTHKITDPQKWSPNHFVPLVGMQTDAVGYVSLFHKLSCF